LAKDHLFCAEFTHSQRRYYPFLRLGQVQRIHGGPRYRYEDNIKMNLKRSKTWGWWL